MHHDARVTTRRRPLASSNIRWEAFHAFMGLTSFNHSQHIFIDIFLWLPLATYRLTIPHTIEYYRLSRVACYIWMNIWHYVYFISSIEYGLNNVSHILSSLRKRTFSTGQMIRSYTPSLPPVSLIMYNFYRLIIMLEWIWFYNFSHYHVLCLHTLLL